MKKYGVIDLFCGCGGMSWGLYKKGFNILAGFDCWDVALSTYQHNMKNAKALNIDLTNAEPLALLKELNGELSS